MNSNEIKPDIKNVRLHVPLPIYTRLRKYKALRVVNDYPEESIAQVCILLIEKGLNAEENKIKHHKP